MRRNSNKIWLLVAPLSVFLFVSMRWQARHEFAEGCDSFGYLCAARQIRESLPQKHLPNFALRDGQVDTLVHLLKSSKYPTEDWAEIVGPHAHHYDAHSRRVILQYPPGTGLVLSVFPEGTAARRLTQIVALAIFFITAWLVAVHPGSPVASIPLVFAAIASIVVCDTIAHYSYSIQASLLPLILGTIWLSKSPGKSAFTTLSALSFSFASLCRIPIAFHFFGWLYCLPPKRRVLFTAFFAISLFSTLGYYNFVYAGSPFRFTYSSADHSPPSLGAVAENLRFYLYRGGAQMNWAVLVMGLVAFFVRDFFPRTTRLALLRCAAIGGLPLVYFLTHQVRIAYYPFPTMLNMLWVFGMTFYATEEPLRVEAARSRKSRFGVSVARLLVVGASLYLGTRVVRGDHRVDQSHVPIELSPVEQTILRDPKTFIFSDFRSGSFWYYYRHPAFKLSFAKPEVRQFVLRELKRAGYDLYWLDDGPPIDSLRSEVRDIRGVLAPAGTVFGRPLYRIDL